jgi:hypothetical protein
MTMLNISVKYIPAQQTFRFKHFVVVLTWFFFTVISILEQHSSNIAENEGHIVSCRCYLFIVDQLYARCSS